MSNSKVKCNGWDSSALTKEDIKATWLRKQEGVIKRDRMLKYSCSHRERRSPHMLMESLYTKDMGMRSCRLEHWGDESKSAKSINSVLIPSEMLVPTKVKLRTLQRQDSGDGQDLSIFLPEEIFQPFGAESIGRRELVSKLQWFPALHECDRVIMRSLSTPRQRVGLMDSLFDNYKKDGDEVSLWSSFVCENSKINNTKKSYVSDHIPYILIEKHF